MSEAFVRRSLEPDRFTIISWATRPGAIRFSMALEYGHFPPGTKANDDYELAILEWADLPWWIVVIPLAARATAEHVAEEHGMRLANGVPRMFGAMIGKTAAMGATRPGRVMFGGRQLVVTKSFPVDHDRAYTLENAGGSPVHLGIGGEQFLRDEEQRWIERFAAEHGIRRPKR